jgi:drug/metabolite transporter (DMT)-like permease
VENQSQLIIQALPPILTSVGGFFVLLFFGYTEELKSKRFMLGALFVLFIWIAYIVVILAGENLTLFSSIITVVSLIISLLFLFILFISNIFNKQQSLSISISIFVLGAVLSTIGFVNYFGMQGRVVVAVQTSACEGTPSLAWCKGTDTYPISAVKMFGEIGVVFDAERLKDVESIAITCPDKDPYKYSLNHFQKDSRGLGVAYVYSKN